MDQLNRPEVFHLVLSALGPTLLMYSAMITEYDSQMSFCNDPNERSELARKKQEAMDESSQLIVDFLENRML